MGWLDDAFDIGAGIVGGVIRGNAIDDAEDSAREFTEKQIAELVAAYEEAGRIGDRGTQEQIEAVLQGNTRARDILQGMVRETAPARATLAEAARTRPTLYPWQQRSMDDLRRAMQHQLRARGTAGMGEGGIAVAFDQMARARERMDAANRGEQLDAASQLARYGFDATGRTAVLEAGQGEQLARIRGGDADTDAERAISVGEAKAGAYGDRGYTAANAALARADLAAETFGSIAGHLAGSSLDRDPARRFARYGLGRV